MKNFFSKLNSIIHSPVLDTAILESHSWNHDDCSHHITVDSEDRSKLYRNFEHGEAWIRGKVSLHCYSLVYLLLRPDIQVDFMYGKLNGLQLLVLEVQRLEFLLKLSHPMMGLFL